MVKRYDVSPFQANYGFLAKKENGKVDRNTLKICCYNTFQTLKRGKYFLFQNNLHKSFSKIQYRIFFFLFLSSVLYFFFRFFQLLFCFFQILKFLKRYHNTNKHKTPCWGSLLVISGFTKCYLMFASRNLECNNPKILHETSLGKRISIIVFSNMTFYAVPNRIIVVYTAANANKYPPSEEINFVLRIWLPPVCMITNACLNPFLFAFRNEQFLTSLMHFARRVISSVCALKKTAFTKPFI